MNNLSQSKHLSLNSCYRPNCFHKFGLNGPARLSAYLSVTPLYFLENHIAIIVRIASMKPAEQYERVNLLFTTISLAFIFTFFYQSYKLVYFTHMCLLWSDLIDYNDILVIYSKMFIKTWINVGLSQNLEICF